MSFDHDTRIPHKGLKTLKLTSLKIIVSER